MISNCGRTNVIRLIIDVLILVNLVQLKIKTSEKYKIYLVVYPSMQRCRKDRLRSIGMPPASVINLLHENGIISKHWHFSTIGQFSLIKMILSICFTGKLSEQRTFTIVCSRGTCRHQSIYLLIVYFSHKCSEFKN